MHNKNTAWLRCLPGRVDGFERQLGRKRSSGVSVSRSRAAARWAAQAGAWQMHELRAGARNAADISVECTVNCKNCHFAVDHADRLEMYKSHMDAAAERQICHRKVSNAIVAVRRRAGNW